MTDDLLITEVRLDTRKAEAAAKRWEKRLEALTKREAALALAEEKTRKETDRLRAEMLRLGRAELAGTKVKGALRKETSATRQALKEQAEASRLLRVQQAALKRETSALRREEDQYRRSLERSTRTLQQHARATERAKQRSARASERTRAVYGAQGEAGGRIEAYQARIGELQQQQREMSTFGGRVRRGARERFAEATSDESVRGYGRQAIGGAGGFAARGVGLAAAGAGAAAGGIGAIAQVGAEREKIKAGLATALGGEKQAEKAFEQIKQFAKETPFAVDEVARAVTKLQVRGLEPTTEAATEALRIYGDVAGAMGKDLDTVIEAVSDASLGEFERLKEAFNVVGHKAGDELSLTFAGVTTTIHNDSKSITDYLKSIGKTNFAGGMEKQAATLGGAWSNLGDAVSNFAEDIYSAGLGDALKEVLHDIIGNVDGAEGLAETIGKNLAEGVKGAYEWFKKILGPMDELPNKISEAMSTGGRFIEMMSELVAVGLSLADALGSDATALTLLVVAAAAALGPFGALAAAAGAAGMAIGALLANTTSHLTLLEDRVKSIQRTAELAVMQEEADRLQGEVDANEARYEFGRKTYNALAEARMREAGVTSVEELSSEDQVKLARAQFKAEQAATPEDQAVFADVISRSENRADRAEFSRLKAIPKGKRKPSEQKRLTALAGKLDEKLPTGGGKKPKASAAEAEQAAKIEEEAKRAGLLAADEARLSGRGAEAVSLGAAAEKETRDRLKGMAARGEALPGEVDTAFARVAGYNEVAAQPPPPVIVNNYKFDVSVPINVDATFSGTPAEFAAEAGGLFLEELETNIFPQVARAVRPHTNR